MSRIYKIFMIFRIRGLIADRFCSAEKRCFLGPQDLNVYRAMRREDSEGLQDLNMLFLSWLSKPCPRTVGRGPVPRRACMSQKPSVVSGLRTFFVLFEGSRGTDNLSRLCSSRSPDLDLFYRGGRRAQTTDIRTTESSWIFLRKSLTKNATFAKIQSVLNIFHDFSQKKFDKKRDIC